MGDERFWVLMMGAFVFGVIGFAFNIIGFDVGFVGFAIFGDSDAGDFDGGVYVGTEWNGNAVVLSGDNLSGSFESRVFDSGIAAGASWNSLSFSSVVPSLEILLSVDGSADVWKSDDSGANWVLVKDDYNDGNGNGATYMVRNSLGDFFILYNQNLWTSSDSGVSWSLINDDFNGGSDSNSGHTIEIDDDDNIFIIDGSRETFRSSDSGVFFMSVNSDFGDSTNAKGMTSDSSGNLYAVDGAADVWTSSDSGITWALVKDDYNDGNGNDATDMTSDSSDNLFILHNQDIWSSSDSGVTWSLINDDFNGGPDSNSGLIIYCGEDDSVYVVDGSEDLWMSDDLGMTFSLMSSDYNGGNGNIFGLGSEVIAGDLTFEIRNCSVSDCSDGVWTIPDLDAIELEGRYFQYRVYFSSPAVGVSPILDGVSIDYDLMNSAPVVDLVSPKSMLYTYNTSLNLSYVFSDKDGNEEACWYEIDSDGDVSLPGCLNLTFDISEGIHNLTIYVNDSFGEVGSDSVDFVVDPNGVEVVLSEPVGVRNSRTGIPVSYSVVGADNCWYNVKTSIGGNVIDNTVLANCSGSSFSVASDGDYVLNLFANNSLGSFDYSSSSFSVDSSIVAPPVAPPVVSSSGGGGGGGGGGSSGVSVVLSSLKIEPISVVASIGEEKSLLVSVKNTGKVAANKCSLVEGDYVESGDIMNIGVGEIVEFKFVLSVLDEGVRELNLSIKCLDDVVQEVPLSVVVFVPEMDVSIDEISFGSKGELLVRYSVDSINIEGRVLIFEVLNSNGEIVGEASVALVGSVGEIVIDLSDVSEGMLKLSVSEEGGESIVEESFIYGGISGLTGFVAFGGKGNIPYAGISVFVFLVLIGLLGWRVKKLYSIKD